MAKDKKRSIDEESKNETLFYYEILGITFIVLTFIILGKLGTVGQVLTSFFKILFGDIYWLFLIFMLLYGILSLLRHKAFDFKNQRFVGFVFFSIALLIFSHFPLHNYIIGKTSGSYFSNLWAVYKSYLDTSIETFLGGGLIGATIFYAFFYLFGKFGVIVIASLIIILGFSLMINRSLIEICKFTFNRLKNMKKGLHNFNSFFKYEIGKPLKPVTKKNIYDKNIKINLESFSSFNNAINYSMQEKIAREIKSTIISVFNNYKAEYKEVNYYISYRLTSFYFIIYSYFDKTQLVNKLNNILEDEVVLGCNDNAVIIQVQNRYQLLLTIKELLMKQESLLNNYIIPLGIKQNGELLDQDFIKSPNLLIIGSFNSGIRNFIKYLIFTMLVKNSTIEFEIEVFDNLEEFREFQDFFIDPKEYNINIYLDHVTKEIEEKLTKLSSSHVLTISEYNKKMILEGKHEHIKRKFIIINHFEENKENYAYFENKLMYITQFGEKCGINIIYIVREYKYLSNIISSLFIAKMIFKTDEIKMSLDAINNENANYLLKEGDAFYSYKNKVKRLQTALITKAEMDNIKKKL